MNTHHRQHNKSNNNNICCVDIVLFCVWGGVVGGLSPLEERCCELLSRIEREGMHMFCFVRNKHTQIERTRA